MKRYDELADWWVLMSPPEDYAAEAGPVARLLDPGDAPGRPRLLELGAGGGHLAALRTARAHLREGGVALFCPDRTVECFAPGATMGGTDGMDRGMRYLEWVHPCGDGSTYDSDLVYILRDPGGERTVVHDRITLGAFARATWIRLLDKAGFGQVAIEQQSGRDVFRARVAGSTTAGRCVGPSRGSPT